MQTIDKPLLEAVGEITIQYHRKKTSLATCKISSSLDAYQVFKGIFPPNSIEHREMMYALFLSRSNTILGYACISIGGISGTVYDPKIVFQLALKLNASGFILAHNHPSGNLKPSEADIQLTKKIKEGALLMDFTLLENPAKLTPQIRFKVPPLFRAKVPPLFRVKLTPDLSLIFGCQTIDSSIVKTPMNNGKQTNYYEQVKKCY